MGPPSPSLWGSMSTLARADEATIETRTLFKYLAGSCVVLLAVLSCGVRKMGCPRGPCRTRTSKVVVGDPMIVITSGTIRGNSDDSAPLQSIQLAGSPPDPLSRLLP